MSTAVSGKVPLAEARQLAMEFMNLFPPTAYARWKGAGSIRRKKAEVGDVDHVVIPAWGDIACGDGLFAQTERVNLLWHHLDALVRGGQVQKHVRSNGSTCWGDKHRVARVGSLVHEIHTADVDNWGAQLAIRTGPGEFSHRLVNALQCNGYVNGGGYVLDKNAIACACGWSGAWNDLTRLAINQRDADNRATSWTNGHQEPLVCPRCGRGRTMTMARVPVPTEEAYFARAGMKYIAPEARME